MRRVLAVLAAGCALCAAPAALAKFGISKTRVILPRLRPPENPPLAETVAVDVRSAAPEVTGAHVSLVTGRLEDALRDGGLYSLVDSPREADAAVRVTLGALRAEVRDEIRMERRSVKVGEEQVWDEKKKKYKTESVYADRDVPISWRIAEGSVDATVEVRDEGGRQPIDAGGAYREAFKQGERIPFEATTEEALKRFLVGGVAERAVGIVAFAPDPVEALLAVNGELKAGNKLAEAGLFREALAEWTRKTYKGDSEAARLHNVGVAYEALAYRLPSHDPEHRAQLERAQDFYGKAQALDPDEKYFRDPLVRIEASLSYAASAVRLMADLDRFRSELARRRAGPTTDPRTGSAPSARPRPAGSAAPPPDAPVLAVASKSAPLRNGSFESSLAPWALTGKGAVVEETGRGRVLEVVPAGGKASARQAVGVDVDEGRDAVLSLEYRVTSGEGRIRVLLTCADTRGRERVSTLEVTAGEGPGGWLPWSADVTALRPRPAAVKDIDIVVEGATVRLDNVALTVR